MPCAITFNTQWYGSSLSHQDYREKQDLIRNSRFSNLEKIRFCNCSIRISSLGLYEENIRFSFSIRIPWFFQTEQTVNRKKSGFRAARCWVLMEFFHIPNNFFLRCVHKITFSLKIADAKTPIPPLLTRPLFWICLTFVRYVS